MLAGVGEGVLDRLNSTLALSVFSEVVRGNPEKLRERYYNFLCFLIELIAGIFSGFFGQRKFYSDLSL